MPSTPSSKTSRFARKPKDRDPDSPGRLGQVRQVYAQTKAHDPRLDLWLAGAFLLVLLVFLGLAAWIGNLFYWVVLTLFGLSFGVLAALLVLGRRAQAAAYTSIEGTPGATGAALSSLKRGWTFDAEPVAADAGRARNVRDMSQAAMVFRAVGRPGVVLVAEGPRSGASRLLAAESKRVTRVVGPEVPVHTLRVGEGDDAIAVGELTRTMHKLPSTLTAAEVGAVTKRLRALGTTRPPIPKGVDPRNARMDRRALRGR